MSALPVSPSVSAPSPGRAVNTAARWVTAASLAVIITFALFVLMQILIRVEVITLPDIREPEVVVLSEYVPPHDPQPRVRPEPVTHTAPPPTPVVSSYREDLPVEDGPGFSPAPVMIEPVIELSGERIALAPSPLSIRVPPVYPARELDRGVTGQCTIRYDILASGATVNLQVTECDSAGFSRATMAAVERWRHQTVQGVEPDRIVNRGVETTLVFDLQD